MRRATEIAPKSALYPARQIAMNAGEDGSVIVGKILEKDQYAYGFDSDRQVRQPGRQRHHRSDQGGWRSHPERRLGLS